MSQNLAMGKHSSALILALMALLLLLFISACTTVEPQETPSVDPQNSVERVPLRVLAERKGFGIGAAATLGPIRKDENYRRILSEEFNQLVTENEMKFQRLQPEQGRFDFSKADEIVEFARSRDMRVFGHTLVWQRGLADWLKAGDWTREELLELLHDHIDTVVSHYRGKVYAWDVVNEALAPDASLRDLIWLRGIGPEYIDLSFKWAREADPQAHLFYNEYDGSGWGKSAQLKVDALYNLLTGLLERGVPLDGVGLQMHIGLDKPPSYEGLKQTLERLSGLGIEIQITETDIRLGNSSDSLPKKLAQQAKVYGDLIRACLDVERCSGFWFWGVTDRYTWVNGITGTPEDPLIFDRFYQPKPAYDAIARELKKSA
ncbi:endo-1,4-beta-xylanase [Lusitaniella coriacea]|uniref:endo-1,4-beta-xylanase n=1 Tax=Lusitaniella coriacea TaxID=1983105 RepID=UPI003CE8CCC8